MHLPPKGMKRAREGKGDESRAQYTPPRSSELKRRHTQSVAQPCAGCEEPSFTSGLLQHSGSNYEGATGKIKCEASPNQTGDGAAASVILPRLASSGPCDGPVHLEENLRQPDQEEWNPAYCASPHTSFQEVGQDGEAACDSSMSGDDRAIALLCLQDLLERQTSAGWPQSTSSCKDCLEEGYEDFLEDDEDEEENKLIAALCLEDLLQSPQEPVLASREAGVGSTPVSTAESTEEDEVSTDACLGDASGDYWNRFIAEICLKELQSTMKVDGGLPPQTARFSECQGGPSDSHDAESSCA